MFVCAIRSILKSSSSQRRDQAHESRSRHRSRVSQVNDQRNKREMQNCTCVLDAFVDQRCVFVLHLSAFGACFCDQADDVTLANGDDRPPKLKCSDQF